VPLKPLPNLRTEPRPQSALADDTWLLSLNAVARDLSVSRRMVVRMIDRGELSEVRIGRRRLVTAVSLADWKALRAG
jgi:excisionase family DNA binding protein